MLGIVPPAAWGRPSRPYGSAAGLYNSSAAKRRAFSITSRSRSAVAGGVQLTASASTAMVARMASSVGPPVAMIGRSGYSRRKASTWGVREPAATFTMGASRNHSGAPRHRRRRPSRTGTATFSWRAPRWIPREWTCSPPRRPPGTISAECRAASTQRSHTGDGTADAVEHRALGRGHERTGDGRLAGEGTPRAPHPASRVADDGQIRREHERADLAS